MTSAVDQISPFERPHAGSASELVALSDGTFLSCYADEAKRWLRTNNALVPVGTYSCGGSLVDCACEIDEETIVTSSRDCRLKVWNVASCECLNAVEVNVPAWSLLVTTKRNSKDQDKGVESTLLCGHWTGYVEKRRLSDLSLLSTYRIHAGGVLCMLELEDGTIVTGSGDATVRRWNCETGNTLQTFVGHIRSIVRVIELGSLDENNRDVIVSASDDDTVRMWKISTGESLRILSKSGMSGLISLKRGCFLSASLHTVVLRNQKGDKIATYNLAESIATMTKLRDGSIVTSSKLGRIDLWKPYVSPPIFFSLQ